jgi:hypothetical protein
MHCARAGGGQAPTREFSSLPSLRNRAGSRRNREPAHFARAGGGQARGQGFGLESSMVSTSMEFQVKWTRSCIAGPRSIPSLHSPASGGPVPHETRKWPGG